MRTLVLLTALGFAASAVGAEAESEPVSESEPEATRGERPRVLVLELQTAGIDAEQAKLVDELITVELARMEAFDVLSGADVKRMVELEAEKQAAGCEDSSCLADIAGAMGARYVVYGRMGKLGSRLIVTLNLFDSETAGAVGRTELKPESMDALPDQLPGAVRDLVKELVPESESESESESDSESEAEAEAEAEAGVAAAAPEGGGGVMALVWPAAFVSTGLLVVVGGVGFDLLSPTSDDAKVDAFDVVGPSIIVVGLTTAVVGLVWNPFAGGEDDA